jgi:precorrin-6B methylase 2
MSEIGKVHRILTRILLRHHLPSGPDRYGAERATVLAGMEAQMSTRSRPHLSALLVILLFAAAAAAQTRSEQHSRLHHEEAARESRERIPELFEAMDVRAGAVVADVGAGGGFLTVRLARAVGPTGRVFAVDVDARMIDRLRSRVEQEGLTNVEVVKGETDDPHLAASSIDAAVIVNSYHEMGEYEAMLEHLRRALKPRGRLVIVEPLSDKRRHASRHEQIRDHEIAPHFVEQEAREAGFQIVRLEDPFTTRDTDVMWLLVAQPDPLASGATSALPVKRQASSPPAADTDADASAISSPDLRIAFERFVELREKGAIIVVDVRSESKFQSGHIPDAIWIPLRVVADRVEQLKAQGKPIVTYCG